MESAKLGPEHVDAFHVVRGGRDCAFKGCNRSGRIKLFWRENPRESQEVSFICVNHAIGLANAVLSLYKFNHE